MSLNKLSIITPSLNRKDMLEKVVENVAAQKYPHYEHIIIDGGSTDGTVEWASTQSHIRFVTEPDKGVYDALNKGLALASGDVIGFLNTDDLYAENIFVVIMEGFKDDLISAVAGKAQVFSHISEGRIETSGNYDPRDKSLLECSTLGKNYFNAWFFRRTVFEKIGVFNINYKVAGDRDFMLRFALNNLKYDTVDKLVYLYRRHPGSLTFSGADSQRELSARDHLTLTRFYLRNWKLSAEERDLIAQLHTRECLEMAKRYKKSGNFIKYSSLIIESVRYDSNWMLKRLWRAALNVIDLAFRSGRYRLNQLTRLIFRE